MTHEYQREGAQRRRLNPAELDFLFDCFAEAAFVADYWQNGQPTTADHDRYLASAWTIIIRRIARRDYPGYDIGLMNTNFRLCTNIEAWWELFKEEQRKQKKKEDDEQKDREKTGGGPPDLPKNIDDDDDEDPRSSRI